MLYTLFSDTIENLFMDDISNCSAKASDSQLNIDRILRLMYMYKAGFRRREDASKHK